MNGSARRCDAIEQQLHAFDQTRRRAGRRAARDGQPGYLTAEKEELAAAASKLGAVMDAVEELGGGLAQAMFTKVADKFYDLVVRSDVGIIDVSWGSRTRRRSAVNQA